MREIIFFSLSLLLQLGLLIFIIAHGFFDWFSWVLILLIIGNAFALYIHIPRKK